MEKGANVDGKDDRYYRWTPLMRAAAAGSVEAVKLLLEKDANPGSRTPEALHRGVLPKRGASERR